MTRVFADLHLRANSKVPGHAVTLAQKAAELGYKLVAIPLSPETTPEEVKILRSTCFEAGLDFVSRVDLRPRNQNELLTLLRRLRRRFEVVCVLCESKDIARQAAKD